MFVKNNEKIKKILELIGYFIAILGLGFVFYRTYNYIDEINFSFFNVRNILLLLTYSFIYFLSLFLIICAWCTLLAYYNVHLDRFTAIKIFGISHISRYVPGNIFHIAGRQGLSMKEGVSSKIVFKTIFLEHLYLSIAASLFSIFLLTILFKFLNIYILIILYFMIFFLLCFIFFYKISKTIAKVIVYYNIYLFISGTTFFLLCALLFNVDYNLHNFFLILAAYVIAWFIGMITPGAPGGLGIRELVLIFLLKGLLIESDLLIAILLGRLTTIFGDVCLFVYALFIRLKLVRTEVLKNE